MLDADELFAAMQHLGLGLTRAETQVMLEEADADGNGEIDFDEFRSIFGRIDNSGGGGGDDGADDSKDSNETPVASKGDGGDAAAASAADGGGAAGDAKKAGANAIARSRLRGAMMATLAAAGSASKQPSLYLGMWRGARQRRVSTGQGLAHSLRGLHDPRTRLTAEQLAHFEASYAEMDEVLLRQSLPRVQPSVFSSRGKRATAARRGLLDRRHSRAGRGLQTRTRRHRVERSSSLDRAP